jgi:hypothetical protein
MFDDDDDVAEPTAEELAAIEEEYKRLDAVFYEEDYEDDSRLR